VLLLSCRASQGSADSVNPQVGLDSTVQAAGETENVDSSHLAFEHYLTFLLTHADWPGQPAAEDDGALGRGADDGHCQRIRPDACPPSGPRRVRQECQLSRGEINDSLR